MTDVDPEQARERFAELLERVALGEEIVIAREGMPLARLVPVPRAQDPKAGEARAPNRREGGIWRGLVRIADDFDAPLPPDIGRGFGLGHR